MPTIKPKNGSRPFEQEWEQNKKKWARIDCKSYRYLYRQDYKIPRVSVEQTNELTEYEFEYEFLLKAAYHEWVKESLNNQPLDIKDRQFGREFSMDPEEYAHIKELSEKGEFIDFDIPKDAPEGNRMSQKVLGIQDNQSPDPGDFEPIDPEEIFNSRK